jgi:hypothetical protein
VTSYRTHDAAGGPAAHLAFCWVQPTGRRLFLARSPEDFVVQAGRAARALAIDDHLSLRLWCRRTAADARSGLRVDWMEAPSPRPSGWPVGLLALDEEVAHWAHAVWRHACLAFAPQTDTPPPSRAA